METIDDVLAKLDNIIEECYQKESRLGFFAILYRMVTQRVKNGIIAKEVENNERMEVLDILFAKRFTDAYDSWMATGTSTKSWTIAFQSSQKTEHLTLQHLFLGINAHINLDLGIAASETMAGQNLEPIQGDFNKINEVLSELVEGVKSKLSTISPLFGWLIPLAKGRDEMLLNFSIQIARDGAWEFAERFHASVDKKNEIIDRDQKIENLAKKLLNPGKLLLFLIKIVKWFEWKSVKKVMDELKS
mgnify:CR=1 FL=1